MLDRGKIEDEAVSTFASITTKNESPHYEMSDLDVETKLIGIHCVHPHTGVDLGWRGKHTCMIYELLYH